MIGLRYRADMQTLSYMLAATAIPIMHWQNDGFSAWLFTAAVIMAFAVSIMHHNHAHVSLWTSPALNRLSDFWFTLFQGHPGFVFEPMHVENHHRHHNGPHDLTRTNRHWDSNNLPGLLLHPFEFAINSAPRIVARARAICYRDKPAFAMIVAHYLLLIAVDAVLMCTDARKATYCVMAPQAAALFFLLISNYLQHAHAEGASELNHSRNFLGLINPLFFNVGYHTAHHYDATRHWSELPALHQRIALRISPQLIEPSFGWYCVRVFFLGFFSSRCRSTPMSRDAVHARY